METSSEAKSCRQTFESLGFREHIHSSSLRQHACFADNINAVHRLDSTTSTAVASTSSARSTGPRPNQQEPRPVDSISHSGDSLSCPGNSLSREATRTDFVAGIFEPKTTCRAESFALLPPSRSVRLQRLFVPDAICSIPKAITACTPSSSKVVTATQRSSNETSQHEADNGTRHHLSTSG
ncbi:unnamed protein product [Protopolystoma xenopodis]|uniref:Uncharacterized protein n=1 Tax=Protopolystoma xenopodis TaxID=117903 RepID=A0A448WJU7_9PLAT|nr:unnamed protein product [Protopolystoma xenopodis]